MWSHFPFRKDVTPLGKQEFACTVTMLICGWVLNKSQLSATNSNQQIPAGHMDEVHFPTLCLQQSAVYWSRACQIGGGNAVIWMIWCKRLFLLLLWWSAQWLKCCTPEVLQSLTVGKPGRGSQKELPFSMTSCSTVRLGVAHPGWDGMHNTGYHWQSCTESANCWVLR